jgi:hypothetical protein
MSFWNGVRWLHLLAIAFFVGGQLMLAAVVVPVMRGAEDRARLLAAAKRFGVGTEGVVRLSRGEPLGSLRTCCALEAAIGQPVGVRSG